MRDPVYPASAGQERLWFLQAYGESAEYNAPLVMRLVGGVDEDALALAVERLVDRHATLRTRFEFGERGLSQVVGQPGAFRVERVDLSQLDLIDAEWRAHELTREAARQPFDLGKGVCRAAVVRVSESVSLLLMVLHHIATDGWSFEILRRELGLLYNAHLRRESVDLPEPAIDYIDYSVWQRQQAEEPKLVAAIEYWRSQLASMEPLELPLDRPRPRLRLATGATIAFSVPGEIGAGLRDLARQTRATLFMVTLAAFQVLLARYSGQTDVAVGTPVANRTQPELEDVVGFFVNTIVLRSEIPADLPFRELVERVKKTAAAAYAHQHVPFETVVEAVQRGRDPSRTPLVQVVFQLLPQDRPLHLQGVEATELAIETDTAKFDLTLSLRDSQDELQGRVEYSTQILEPPTVERLAGDYVRLLRTVAADPDSVPQAVFRTAS